MSNPDSQSTPTQLDGGHGGWWRRNTNININNNNNFDNNKGNNAQGLLADMPTSPSTSTSTSILSSQTNANTIQNVNAPSNNNHVKVKRNTNKNDDDDDDDDDFISQRKITGSSSSTSTTPSSHAGTGAISSSWGHLFHLSLRLAMGATITLYILNQKHLLPKPLSAVVSKTLFWPTLPITVSRRFGKWVTSIDDTLVLGGAPLGFCNIPEKLHDIYGVKGVVNMCEEYEGPLRKYDKLGMQELRLKTVDHFEPTVSDLQTAVSFIRKNEMEQKRVYVHCRAGHGRSAAVALAWLMYKHPDSDPRLLNQELCQLRDVRKTLWKQPNIREFHASLQKKNK